jgi:hypothetical protein
VSSNRFDAMRLVVRADEAGVEIRADAFKSHRMSVPWRRLHCAIQRDDNEPHRRHGTRGCRCDYFDKNQPGNVNL